MTKVSAIGKTQRAYVEFKGTDGAKIKVDKKLFGSFKPAKGNDSDIIVLANGIEVSIVKTLSRDELVIDNDDCFGSLAPATIFSGKGMDIKIDARNSRKDIIGVDTGLLADVIIEDGDIAQTKNLFVTSKGKK